MIDVAFLQVMRPYGNKKRVTTKVNSSLQSFIEELEMNGAIFECEVLTTGEVSFTIEIENPEYGFGDEDVEEYLTLSSAIAANNETITNEVERLIKKAHEKMRAFSLS